MKGAGYDAVELQIADPAQFDEGRVRRSLDAAGYAMLRLPDRLDLLQPGQLSVDGRRGGAAADRRPAAVVRRSGGPSGSRLIVFGSLQGRLNDEPDRAAGGRRIREAVAEVGPMPPRKASRWPSSR